VVRRERANNGRVSGNQRWLRLATLLFFVGGLCLQGVSAQDGSVVELRSADELEVHEVNGEEVRELIGNVHFIQLSEEGDSIFVWTDRAMRYMVRDAIELFGHVRIVRGDATLRSSVGMYYSNDKKAEMPRGVTLEQEGVVLTAWRGTYWVDEDRAFFEGDVVLVDSVSRTTSDALTYYEADERAVAVGNVRVQSLKDNVTILGDSLVHYRNTGTSIVPKNPTLIQIDTSSVSEGDTLVIVSQHMEAYRDTADRFVAVGDVKIVRGDLSSRCERAIFDRTHDLMILQEDPVVWQGENQMTGDSIVATVKENELRRLRVIGRAMAISRSDSVFRQRFNQLTGQEIILSFKQRKLQEIEVLRNATSLYYLYEESEPNGVNRSSGDRIRIDFVDGSIDRITVIGGVEGTYAPEAMVANRESEFNLDGFRWIEQRPSRNQFSIALKSYD
jgi:lipopolysaccharide export system protein LptA